ncbi:hypothetical protein COLO4_00359 [Corchorus olitorius]|uniref:Uncharacterized protein n=1 Tax=Corchorus olitorius TaxID=93759 RepID=A0A1R3L439_9ROSI|nr:hypothetical protein COLO4_00359 [Corchorus olitorius]
MEKVKLRKKKDFAVADDKWSTPEKRLLESKY